MILLFRVDAIPTLGMGHLIRSLLIAKTIRRSFSNTEIIFLIQNDAFTINKINNSHFQYIISTNQDEEQFILSNCSNKKIDVLFIDKFYNYSCDFIQKLIQYCKVIMFHNLCEGAHLCDAFILPAAHIRPEILNDPKWFCGKCQFYEGIKYVVINDKITEFKPSKRTNSKLRTIVITTGGSDPSGVLLKVLNWINKIELKDVKIYALVGESFSHSKALDMLKGELKSNIIVTPYEPSILTRSDIAISTFGVSTYELLYLGLIVVNISHSKDNEDGGLILSRKYNQLIDLGNIEKISITSFTKGLRLAIDKLENNKITYCEIDKRGVNRVSEIIYNLGKGEY